MSPPFALLTSASQPPLGFERLTDLAHHVLWLAEEPASRRQRNVEMGPVVVSVAAGPGEPETRPAVSVRLIADDGQRTILGYARVGQPGRDPLDQREELMTAVIALLKARAGKSASELDTSVIALDAVRAKRGGRKHG